MKTSNSATFSAISIGEGFHIPHSSTLFLKISEDQALNSISRIKVSFTPDDKAFSSEYMILPLEPSLKDKLELIAEEENQDELIESRVLSLLEESASNLIEELFAHLMYVEGIKNEDTEELVNTST